MFMTGNLDKLRLPLVSYLRKALVKSGSYRYNAASFP